MCSSRFRAAARGARVGRGAASAVALALVLAGLATTRFRAWAGASSIFFPDDPVWIDQDREAIEQPRSSDPSHLAEAVKNSFLRPPTWQDEGGDYAWNINTLGEVPDSSWFTNRHGRSRMSAEELATGPDRSGPPESGTWHVVGGVGEGITEKFRIRDGTTREFIVKLENPRFPELMSSAEVICTKFFHSFGFNVPENYVVSFRPEDLVVEDGETPLDLDERFREFPRTPDGSIRAVASLLLPGEPLGPFSYADVREDDPNDLFPHEHRRELRALRVFAAWLNHTDVKAGNSLDTFIEIEGGGYVRHHLIDFGSCLGSSGKGVKTRLTGHEYYLEPTKLMMGAATFGVWHRPYVALRYPSLPAVGHLEADYYEPWRWKPPIPNPAFRLMDAADAFWAASIVARFTEDDVRTLVSTAGITDPAAESHLVDVLLRRQKKTVAYWLTRTNPLDRFEVSTDAEEGPALVFENAALREGLGEPTAAYRHRWLRLDNETGVLLEVVPESSTRGIAAQGAVPVADDAFGAADRFGLRYAVVEIETDHPEFPHWRRPVVVTLRSGEGSLEVVGVRRPRAIPPRETED